MTATDLYKAGQLDEALAAHQDEVRKDPVNPEKRLFLFELLTLAGDFERAAKQLEAVNYDKLELEAAVLKYKQVLKAEAVRLQFFSDGVPPKFFIEAPESVQWRLDAVARMREKKFDEMADLLGKANEAMPPRSGKFNGKLFQSIRDGDDLLAGVIEVYAQDQYHWVPFEHLLALAMVEPSAPRDLIFAPARMTLIDGQEGEVFLPCLYPNSHLHSDVAIKMGRATDWNEIHPGVYLGVGQKDFVVGEEPKGILECRELLFGEPEEDAEAAPAEQADSSEAEPSSEDSGDSGE